MHFETFLQANGIPYRVIREGSPDRYETGLINNDTNGRLFIGFRPGTDVMAGDILGNPAGDRFHVVDTQTDYFRTKPLQLKAYYKTEAEIAAESHRDPPVYVENAYNAVIGSGNMIVVSYSEELENLKAKVSSEDFPDKQELEKLISLLEMVVNGQVPVSKGLFSKFLHVMEKNSWITGAVTGVLLNWLTSQL